MRSDGIVHAVFDFDGSPGIGAAEEYLAVRNELIGTSPIPVLLEIVRMPYVNRSHRQFLMEELTPPPFRAVVTTDSSLVTMFRTFQLVDKADVPTEFFRTVAAAVEWIEAQTATGQVR